MSINKKLFVITVSFLISILLASLVIVTTSDYKNNDVIIHNASLLEDKLLVDLDLDRRLYFFTPKFVVENKLDDLGYIKNYNVQRKFPNFLDIDIELGEVLWCDDLYLYYGTVKIKKDRLEEYCIAKPKAIGLANIDVLSISSDYANVDDNIKNLVLEIIYLDGHTISFKMTDGTTVYMTLNKKKTITSQLNNYLNYKVTNKTLDLRQKYS